MIVASLPYGVEQFGKKTMVTTGRQATRGT